MLIIFLLVPGSTYAIGLLRTQITQRVRNGFLAASEMIIVEIDELCLTVQPLSRILARSLQSWICSVEKEQFTRDFVMTSTWVRGWVSNKPCKLSLFPVLPTAR